MIVLRPDDAPIGAERTDPVSLRRILGHFCTGVVVVTAVDDGEPVGMTCQSFSSLSLDPPLVLFSASHSSTSWPRIRAAGSFAVNILAVHQERVSRVFAASGTDKFAEVDWSPGMLGAPLLTGCVAHIECRLESVFPGGDHDIVTGAPLALREEPAHVPLLFFRSGYGRFEA